MEPQGLVYPATTAKDKESAINYADYSSAIVGVNAMDGSSWPRRLRRLSSNRPGQRRFSCGFFSSPNQRMKETSRFGVF
jgi:hypothetical protein